MFDPVIDVSLLVFIPAVAAVLLAFFPKGSDELAKIFTFAVTVFVLIWACVSMLGSFDLADAGMQMSFNKSWIPSFDIEYLMGVDGISLPLIILTVFITALSMVAAWSITENVKAFCMLFLVLETGMIGVFLALDFFLFYVFWEVMLLPMYFLIGVWGGPRKEYAAIKFFLYTLFGSVLMLIAILMLYFASDLTQLARQGISLEDLHLREEVKTQVSQQLAQGDQAAKVHTFNMLALAAMGTQTDLFSSDELLLKGWTIQHWAFLLLFIGFIIKVPCVPVHTWLPDAHVEAPTPISMILAGILLKMGGYGIIRICYPICPHAGYDFATFVCALGVLSMVYGAFAALAQTDFKRMVAYSSVSHMGYVVLGLGVWSATSANMYDSYAWNMGIKGAMFQMIGHGVSSAGMFFMVGVVYERVHHRNLNEFGGLYGRMPVYTALAMIIFFAALGLPGLCGFIGEVFVVLSVWNFSHWMAVVSAGVVILTAGYILWAIQRVYLGAEYKGPHGDDLTPIRPRELSVAVILAVFAVILGVYPTSVLRYMDATIDQQVTTLTEWTEDVKTPQLRAEAAAEAGAGAPETAAQPNRTEVESTTTREASLISKPQTSTRSSGVPVATVP